MASKICPDHKMSCRKGQTCCDNQEGGYACCPYENATCCSDGRHCCPEDTTCDLSAGRCRRKVQAKVQRTMFPALNVTKENYFFNTLGFFGSGQKVVKDCPDGKQSCPSTYTCCQDPFHGYSCCPYENAICCSDNIHCCPHGSKCGDGKCE